MPKGLGGTWRARREVVQAGGTKAPQVALEALQPAAPAGFYVPDRFDPFPDLTVMETFALVAALTRGGRPDRATLDRFGVSGFVHQRVSRLSAGQTERTALVAGRIGP